MCISAVTPISYRFSSHVGTFIPVVSFQFPPLPRPRAFSFHRCCPVAASFRCQCLYISLSFLPVSSSFPLSFQFLYSLHECSFGDVSTLFCSLHTSAPHLYPHIIPISHSACVHHFLPDRCRSWSIRDIAFSTFSAGNQKKCFHTHKLLPYFSVYLNTQGHGHGSFFLYPSS